MEQNAPVAIDGSRPLAIHICQQMHFSVNFRSDPLMRCLGEETAGLSDAETPHADRHESQAGL